MLRYVSADSLTTMRPGTPYWSETAVRLRTYKDIRNILTHRRGVKAGYPVAVTPASLLDLREIAQSLAPSVSSLRAIQEAGDKCVQ